MNDLSVAFKITSERHCPLYAADDIFVLSAQSVKLPLGHSSCLILVRELTKLLFTTIVPSQGDGLEKIKDKTFSCGGCTGLIKFQIEEDLERVDEEIAAFPVTEEVTEGDDGSKAHREKHDGIVLSGQLSEVSPSELMQFFHMHQKTGKLVFDVDSGAGKVYFREGAVITAKFMEYEGKEAFFSLLREKHGRFSFVNSLPDSLLDLEDIGDFMMILMEGIKRMDEEEHAE